MASGFVSTTELTEERKKAQEEWERVRKPDDPIKAPEPEVCNKTLFEQLRDNKEAKQAEFDESRKYKNMIRGIDEDESEFLAEINELRRKATFQNKKEEEEIIKELAVSKAQVQTVEKMTTVLRLKPSTTPTGPATTAKSKQASILSMAIKRKCSDEQQVAAKVSKSNEAGTSATQIVGAIPGIIDYEPSSDSESSNSSDEGVEDDIVAVIRPSSSKNKGSDEEEEK